MQSTTENRRLQPVKLFSKTFSPPDVTDSSPIIFIHGLCTNNTSWKNVSGEISNNTKRKIYEIDLRNHGKSEWPKEFSVELCIDDLENFMITENIPKAVLVGQSLGGRIAMGLALRKPDMVEKLVVEDISLVDTGSTLAYIEKTAKFLVSVRDAVKFLPSTMTEMEAQKKLLSMVSSYFPGLFKNISEANISITVPFSKDTSGKWAFHLDTETVGKLADNMDALALDLSNNPIYQGEMLLLGGDKSDFLQKKDVDTFHKHFSKCQSYFFRGGVHNLHIEFAEMYKEIVTNFIGQ